MSVIEGTACPACAKGLILDTCDNPECAEQWIGLAGAKALDARHDAKRCPPGACSRCRAEAKARAGTAPALMWNVAWNVWKLGLGLGVIRGRFYISLDVGPLMISLRVGPKP